MILKERWATVSTITISITRPVEAKSLRSQPLYLGIECFHVLGAPLVFGFRLVGGSQFFERFFDREFWYFGHGT